MGEPKRIDITSGSRSSGVDITFIKRRQVLSIGGWFDTYVGIGNQEIPLREFLTQLGITLKDVRKALEVTNG